MYKHWVIMNSEWKDLLKRDPIMMITLCVTTFVMTFALIYAYINYTAKSTVNGERNLRYEFVVPEELIIDILDINSAPHSVESISIWGSVKNDVPVRLVKTAPADPHLYEQFKQIHFTVVVDNPNYPNRHLVHRSGTIDFKEVENQDDVFIISGSEEELSLATDGLWLGEDKFTVIGQAMGGIGTFYTTRGGFLKLLPKLEDYMLSVRTIEPLNAQADRQLISYFENLGLSSTSSPSAEGRQAALDSVSQMFIISLFYCICFMSFLSLLGELLARQKNRHRAALLVGATPKKISSLVVQIVLSMGILFSGIATVLYALFYRSFFQKLNFRLLILMSWQEFVFIYLLTIFFMYIAAKLFALFYTQKRIRHLLRKG